MAEVSAEQLKRNKPGATQEESAGLTGQAGLYRHRTQVDEHGNPVEVATKYDPLYGNVQTEALLRGDPGNWLYLGEVPKGYAKELLTGSLEAEASKDRAGISVGEAKGINARLDAAEAENARLKEQLAQRDGAATPNEVVDADKTKADAAANVESGASTGTAPDVTTGTENTPVTEQGDGALTSKDSRDKWNTFAKSLGIEDAEDMEVYKTKAELIAAVEAKQEDQESEN